MFCWRISPPRRIAIRPVRLSLPKPERTPRRWVFLAAVVGLIAALSDMSDIEKLAHAICRRLHRDAARYFHRLCTVDPISNKLKRISKREVQIKLMMVEGLLSIQSGVSTIAITQKLYVYLTPKERIQMQESKEGKLIEQEA